jgi:hypothetical protein
MVLTRGKTHSVALALEVAEQRILAFVAEKVREIS